jgi:hypothetical protein
MKNVATGSPAARGMKILHDLSAAAGSSGSTGDLPRTENAEQRSHRSSSRETWHLVCV